MLLPAWWTAWACPQGKSKFLWTSLAHGPPHRSSPSAVSYSRDWTCQTLPSHLAASSSSCRARWNLLPPRGPRPGLVWARALCALAASCRVSFPPDSALRGGTPWALLRPVSPAPRSLSAQNTCHVDEQVTE